MLGVGILFAFGSIMCAVDGVAIRPMTRLQLACMFFGAICAAFASGYVLMAYA